MKRYLILIAVFCMLISVETWGQCPSGDVTLISQEDIDEFAAMYPNCTEIEGDLLIGDSSQNNNINDIDALCQISAVGGAVSLYMRQLNAVDCFNNIDSIGGDINITRYYGELSGFTGFNNLNYAGGNVDINIGGTHTDNNTFTGFNNLAYIEGGLSIHTDIFDSLIGFEQLEYIGGGLLIELDYLTNLSGFGALQYIGGTLRIRDNYDLSNFTGFDALTSIGGNLSIFASKLNTLNNGGFANLISVGGDIEVERSEINYLNFDNVSSFDGEIKIFMNYELDSLSGFQNVDSIRNIHFDTNDELKYIRGFDNIVHVEGNLIINSSVYLSNINGFENLISVGGNFELTNIDFLEDMNNFGQLSFIGGNVELYNNIASNTIVLDSLSSVGGDFTLDYFISLYDISFENLNSIGGFLKISSNDNLTSLSGLNNIDHTTISELVINSNNNLSLCGVESICHYLAEGGTSTINGNAEGCNTISEIIQSCADVWDYAVEGNIFIDTNDDCFQDSTEQDLNGWIVKIENAQDTRYAYTYDNGKYVTPTDTGTYIVTPIPPNSLWEDMCLESDVAVLTPFNTRDTVDIGATTSTFCPLLEIDVTAPFVRRCFDSNYYVRYCNSGTAIAENAYVEVQLDPFFTYNDATIEGIDLGENLYSFDLENIDIGECGSFRIDVYVDCDSTEIGQAHCVEAHIYPDTFCTSDLPLWDGASIEVDAQCLGDSIEFKIENVGTGDMSDSLEYMVIEEDLTYERANFQLNSGESKVFYKAANGLFHRLEAEQSPGHPGNSMPSVFVEGCGENDNGEISVGFVNYYLLDEGDAFVSIDCQENIGSYDPNDKQAFPVGYGAPHFITDSTDLEYLIRFQNTGTDTAFTVVIRDTISPHLNIETLRPGVASHDYRYDIEESNIAVFHFENIMLPDSNVNEAASHGFIKFDINQKQNNPIGTHIMNDAAIYFDFNEPIITNTVFHTVGEDFMGLVTSIITPPEVSEVGISVNVFPNPFDEYTRFEVKGEITQELHLSLYDMMGREVLQQKATHQQHITIKRNNLTPGVYVFRLMDEKQQLATGKLVIQ